ncbi:MAG: hypothetical protein LBH48_01825, partial [Bifidobacteriaceae bacterium]|nr:hypothetical protein [Bifidobacteriaceae bacterium]
MRTMQCLENVFATSPPKRRLRRMIPALLAAGTVALGASLTPLTVGSALAQPPTPIYLDTNYSFSLRAADLVSRMTTAEKVLQFRAERQYQSGIAPGIPRLGVDAYNYWNEAMHGVAHAGRVNGNVNLFNRGGYATEFPSPIAMGASWNRDLIRYAGSIVSDEGRAMSQNDNTGHGDGNYVPHKGLTYWTPTINMARDPRWGRSEESYSEDPYLTAEIAGQYVNGLQGDDPKYLKVAATPKHYLANDSENNRRWGTSNLTEQSLREYYTPAFADLLGPKYKSRSVMTAYNSIAVENAPASLDIEGLPNNSEAQGVPMSASRYSLETLARRTWGFQGAVVSDCGAVGDVYNSHRWIAPGTTTGIAQTEAAAWTLKAGLDLVCSGGEYANPA